MHGMILVACIVSVLGGLQDQGDRLRLLENTMIMNTFILDVIDYDRDYSVKQS